MEELIKAASDADDGGHAGLEDDKEFGDVWERKRMERSLICFWSILLFILVPRKWLIFNFILFYVFGLYIKYEMKISIYWCL